MTSSLSPHQAGVARIQQRVQVIEQRFAPPTRAFSAVLADAAAAAPSTPAAAPSTPAAAPSTPAARTAVSPAPARLPAAATSPRAGSWASDLPPAGRAWAPAIEQAALRAGVEPALLGALVWTESAFDPTAVSHAGAIGLAQLMPDTAAGMGVDPHDPRANLDGGARFLRAQLDRFGSPELALAAYNAGPGRVAEAGGIPDIDETRAYVPAVLQRYATLRGVT